MLLERQSDELDIRLKDNFFEKNIYDNILKNIVTYNFSSNASYPRGEKNTNHIWFSVPCEENINDYIVKRIKDLFNLEVEIYISFYTLLTKMDKIRPHHDKSEHSNYQSIIYLKGDSSIHSGTGYYIKEDKNFVLNTHIGFNPNRIVFWNSGAWHSPLTFTEEFKPRYSIITQYKTIE